MDRFLFKGLIRYRSKCELLPGWCYTIVKDLSPRNPSICRELVMGGLVKVNKRDHVDAIGGEVV
jgi:hypothetical protein